MASAGAGAKNRLVDFCRPVMGDGGAVTGWEVMFSEAARIKPAIGGESVVASRLQGRQPHIVTVWSSARTRGVGLDWRIVNRRSGAVYAIKSFANVDERDMEIDFQVVEGDDG